MSEFAVALDVASQDEALALVDRIGEAGDFYKVGLELYTRAGPDVVRALTGRGKRVFLDLKLHDIPHTVARAVEAAAALGVELLTVHAAGGEAMLRAAAEAAGEEVRVVGVTVLTSLTVDDLEAAWGRTPQSLREEAVRLAGLCREAGLAGVVASALEARPIKRLVAADLLVVTPGIRPAGADTHDQARVATPAEAVAAGSDVLVVGRAVTRADDPAAALAALRAEVDAVEAAP
ncbi:MAG: orotidine-5'-phosphate decarboxylase [Gemmatimonadetes bacterium]|nr:MAG: orotidine-5'-phosphate decarboxylase [Gemmatimonadota bacterium]